MQIKSRQLEQQVAVFGESGSGKTVLLSTFYGAAQEPKHIKENFFNVVADNVGQGNSLHKNYLKMRDSAGLPALTAFDSDSYAFSIKLKNANPQAAAKSKTAKKQPFDALRLIWHDYPGEWFEQDARSPEDASRRVETFRSLLRSDVALILVDGQRLIDNAGEEERYLKALITNFRNGILSLKDDLLDDGEKIVDFPRIWVIALSKADLLPDMDVYAFRDLMVGKVAEELGELREVIGELVEGQEALSIGEDFMLLSSGKFQPDLIELDQRVGVDLVLPLGAVLPFQRHVRWAQNVMLPARVVASIVPGVTALAAALVANRRIKLPGPLGRIASFIGTDAVLEAVSLAGDRLSQLNEQAREKNDNVRATLTRFIMDLDKAEEERALLRSQR